MKYLKLTALIFLLLSFFNSSYSEDLYFVNMQKILNNSKAGSAAQESLKKEFAAQTKKFKGESAALKKQETELISQKKTLFSDKISERRLKNWHCMTIGWIMKT